MIFKFRVTSLYATVSSQVTESRVTVSLTRKLRPGPDGPGAASVWPAGGSRHGSGPGLVTRQAAPGTVRAWASGPSRRRGRGSPWPHGLAAHVCPSANLTSSLPRSLSRYDSLHCPVTVCVKLDAVGSPAASERARRRLTGSAESEAPAGGHSDLKNLYTGNEQFTVTRNHVNAMRRSVTAVTRTRTRGPGPATATVP